MKKAKYLILLAVVLAILLLFRAFALKKKAENKPSFNEITEDETISVVAEKAITVEMKERITAVGNIEPLKTIVIYPEVSGILEKLAIKEGALIEKGSLVAVIESQQRQLRIEQVESEINAQKYQLENIRQDYNRYKRLAEEGAVAPKRFEDTETLYRAAEERILGLEKQLEMEKRKMRDARIFSPMSGIVSKKFIDEGELVTESSMSKSSPLAEIIDISKVKIIVPIGETDIKKIRHGQNVSIETDVYQGVVFRGKIEKIMPVTDFVTRTTKVEILVDNPSFRLKPGLFTRAVIETGKRAILALPLDALMKMQGSGNYYCFKIEDGTVEKTYLEIGDTWEGMAEITKGLKEGDSVVVSSQGILETGKKVKVSY